MSSPTSVCSSEKRSKIFSSNFIVILSIVICFLVVAIYATTYVRRTKALIGVLNPCFFCVTCEMMENDPLVVEANPVNLTSSKLYPWRESPAVIYFVVSEAVDNEAIEVAITFPIKETILVLSSEKRVTFKVSISNDYKSTGSRLTNIYVNGPLLNTVELKDSSLTPTITNLCDESDNSGKALCNTAYIKVSNSYIWSSGGSTLQNQMATVIGRSYTTYVGCEKGQSFKIAYDTKDGCEPLSGGAIAGIVIGVVIPVLAICCGCLLGAIRVAISCCSK